ncbi:MAG: hypothetical protein Q9168_001693 [Polycauliona sp. 1 TL-2023]
MDFSTDSTQYYDSRAYQLQDHHSSVLQHDQANRYAFNANSHMLPSNSHLAPSTASPLSHGNDDRSKVFSGSSTHAQQLYPGFGTHSTARDLSNTAQSLITTHDPGSDMEDGELSEGAGYSSSREPTSHPSQKVNGTPGTKVPNQNGLHQAEAAVRQKKEEQPRAVNGAMKHSPNVRPTNQVPISTNRKQGKKSLHDLQSGARHAVVQLQRHDIGYAQLLEENIHPDLLRKLYPDSLTNASQQTHDTTATSKPPIQTVQPHPLPKKLPEPTSRQQASTNPVHESMPGVPSMKSLKSATKQFPQARQLGQSDEKLPRTQAGASGEKAEVQKGPKHQQSTSVVEREPAVSKGLVSPINHNSSGGITSNALGSNDKLPAPDGKDNKSIAVPSTAPNSVHPSITHPMVKPAIPKAPAKPVDRKDYIARLQAAKAGKVASAAAAPQLSLGSTTQKALQESSPSISSQLGAASPVSTNSAKQLPAGQTTSPIDSSATAVSSPLSTVETKKREKTELARRKIEELKNRSNLPKVTQPANVESLLRVASPKEQPMPKELVVSQPIQASTTTTSSAIAPSTPQHAYFPLRNGTFSLPGLFMSTANDPSYHDTKALRIAAVQSEPHHLGEPETIPALPLIRDSLSSKPIPMPESSVPSFQEKENLVALTIGQVAQAQANGNPRKRPTAADFIEPMPSKFQRSYSYKADSSVVFEVSDDEADETDDESSDVEMSGYPGMKASQSRKIQVSQLATPDDLKSHQHLTLNDLRGMSDKSIASPNMVHPSPQISAKKDADGLRAREKEIEQMNLKIMEMEQRRKRRQEDISRTQTPGHATPSVKPKESNSHFQVISDGTKRLSEPPSQAVPTHETEDASHGEPAASKETIVQQQGESPKYSSDVQPPSEDMQSPIQADEQQLQRRKSEIQSSLSSADAAVEDLRLRLEALHKDEVDLQMQIQKQMDSKVVFQQELVKLLQAPSSSAALPGQSEDKIVKLREVSDDQQPVTNARLKQALDDNQATAVDSTGISDDPPTDREFNKTDLLPDTVLSTEAPSDQSLISGELAEDVMDISGSEDEADATEKILVSNTDAGQPAAESDSEEPYEPPSSFGGMETTSKPLADSSTQQQSLTNESLQEHDNLEANHTLPAMDNSTAIDAYVAAEDQPHEMAPPGHARSPVDSSDSDDYEPPEPVASVDLATLTSDNAAAAAESSSSPPDTNHKIQANPASPDVPPAIIDPDDHLSSNVSTVRELTQASNVADDMILVQMGSIPEGFSEEQRTAFVVGLRQTIQKIRVRKVKDFKTVASEIAAYRARFLGDSSKILPL